LKRLDVFRRIAAESVKEIQKEFDMTWFTDASERALATFAQAFLSVVGGDVLNVWTLDWKAALGVGLGGAILSMLKSVVARFKGDENSASLAN
jgi:hypothetical protein